MVKGNQRKIRKAHQK